MHTIISIILLASSITLSAGEISKKPDFLRKDKSGKITHKGVHTTDDSGYVIRYDIYDSSDVLVATIIPYYAKSGKLLECRQYDAKGRLGVVAVFVGKKLVYLDPTGKFIDSYDEKSPVMNQYIKQFQK